MTSPLRVYVGWDVAETHAFPVCQKSMLRFTSRPVEIIPIWSEYLKIKSMFWRDYYTVNGQMYDKLDGQPFSTQFSFGRFGVVPLEMEKCQGEDWVLFIDADMLFRADVAELFDLVEDDMAVMCVKHKHEPPEHTKILGQLQTLYHRKNWSSVMLIKPNKCPRMTVEALNTWLGSELHGLNWVNDDQIGGLPEEWNWLEGWSSDDIEPKLLHYTRGTPEMPGHADARCADEWRSYV